MRTWPLALLAAGLLAPAAAALDVGALADLDELERTAQRLLLPGGDVGVGDAVHRAARGPDAPSAGGAGPAPPPALADDARGALLWLLAAGGGAAMAGWRHVHRRNVLDHPGRLAILQLLRRQPGLHLRAIARATGLPAQRAAYHLRMLERLGLVASRSLGGKRCYHEAGLRPEVKRALLDASLAPSPAQQRVLALLAQRPGLSQSEVARQLGMLPGRARWHLRRLAARGALVEARAGKALTYRPASIGPRP